MLLPNRRHWFALALGALIVNAGGMAWLVHLGYLRRSGAHINRFEPQGEADPEGAVRVTFDRPMVRGDKVGKPLGKSPIRFTPRILGVSKWEDPRTLAFVPAKPLPRATPYSALVDRRIRSLDGHPLAGNRAFCFNTPRLAWLAARQVELAHSMPTLSLTFNDRVVPAILAKHLELRDDEGAPVAFRLASDKVAKRVQVQALAPLRGSAQVTIRAGLRGVSGPLGMESDKRMTVDLTEALRITSVDVSSYGDDPPHLDVYATRDIDLKSAKSKIRIEPAVDFRVESPWSGELQLYGDFQYATRYKITFTPELATQAGATLGEEQSWVIKIPDADPYVRFASDGVYLSTKGRLLLPLDCMNVNAVEVSMQKIYPNNLVTFVRDAKSRYDVDEVAEASGYSLPGRTVPVKCAPNESARFTLNLRKLLGDNLMGPTRITVVDADAKYSWRTGSKIVLVTNIGLLVKRSDHDMLVWATAIDDTSPIAGAKVSVYSIKNQLLLEGVTDEQGFAHFQNAGLTGERKPFLVAAAKGDDLTYVEIQAGEVSTAGFDVDGRPGLRKGYEAFVYTDRGIYRPGETVYVRTIVRGKSLALPGQFPVQVAVVRPDDREVLRKTETLSRSGTAAVTATLPDACPTGEYTVSVSIPGGQRMGTATFLVEEFVPDRMKADVAIAPGAVEPGAALTVTVSASHLLGYPAAGRTAACRAVWRARPFEHDAWKDYVFFDEGVEWEPIREDLGEATLDEKGLHVFSTKVPRSESTPARLVASVIASVREVGGRGVTARDERVVDLRPCYVGIGQPRPAANGEAALLIPCAAVAPNGAAYDLPKLQCTLEKIVWHTMFERGDDGRYRYVSSEEVVPVSTFELPLRSGRGVARIAPDSRGCFRLRIADPASGAASSRRFWSTGSGDTSWDITQPDHIEIKTDRTAYQPGEVATVVVRSPFPGRMLLCVENDGVLDRRVVQLVGNTAELNVLIKEGYGPTAYITATVLRPLQTAERFVPHRAMGVVPVAVVEPQKQLRVTLASVASARPGQRLRVRVQVQGPAAAGAEVALAAVDLGVCRLTGFATPDPWSFFTAKRLLAQHTADVYSRIHPDYPSSLGASSTPAGDDDLASSRRRNPIQVRRVKPVALWLGTAATDETGAATFAFTAPDFDGRLRLMAVAASAGGVGSGDSECAVANPVLVEASWPRFASTRDVFQVPIAITNRTGADGVAFVQIEATGALHADVSDEQPLALRDGEEKVVRFTLRAAAAPGKAWGKVRVSLNGESATRSVELAVRPPAPATTISGLRTVMAGETAHLQLPSNFLPDTAKRTLVISPRPDVDFGDALNYLLRYPYGCAEQTTSTGFGLLAAGDVAASVDPGRFDKGTVDRFMQAAINKLEIMQASDGGMALWSGYRHGQPWLSAYAAHFLVEAAKAGYAAPADLFVPLLEYVDEVAANRHGPTLAARSYACYVLALAGSPRAQHVDSLAAQADKLWPSSRCHLAAARWLAGDRAGAAPLLGAALPLITSDRMQAAPWRSYAQECAIMLTTLLDAAPDDPRVPALVKRLSASRKRGRWYTTNENALAVFALAKYGKTVASEPADFVVQVLSNGQRVAEVASGRIHSITLPADGGDAIDLRVSGKGRAYCRWSVEGVPGDGKVAEADAGLRVRRQYLDRDGKPLAEARFVQGEVYQVELTIRAEGDVKNVAIVDLLPAGLEIENTRLATREQWDDEDNTLEPDHVDVRDDRLLLFADLPARESKRFRYVVRAVTAGEFHLGPVRAECMYDPDVSSVSGAGACRVVAR